MGTSGPGEIARLCDVARPDVGVVTNVSAAHLEGLGDEEGVAHEKAALVRCLPPEGRAVLNGDDPRVAAMARQTTAPALRFSLGDPRAEVWGCEPRRTPRGVEFFLYGKMRIFLPVPGLHNVQNALAAVAVGLLRGIEPGALREALRGVRLPSMRMQRIALGGRTLLLDCYNANPASLRAAVEELAARPARGRRVLVMGDMRELGPRSADLHWAAGRHAASRVDFLWCVGPESRQAFEAARDAGLPEDRLAWSPSVEDAAAVPAVRLARGDVALLKASRGMRLERLADVLRRGAAERPALAAAGAGDDASIDARRVG
jgi:UDP-N-acetylmuramoyl-tripeptide--D-alanyl-D-alanine ligase